MPGSVKCVALGCSVADWPAAGRRQWWLRFWKSEAPLVPATYMKTPMVMAFEGV